MEVDTHLDRLVRSSDPNLRKLLEGEVRQRTSGAGEQFHFVLAEMGLKVNPQFSTDQRFASTLYLKNEVASCC